MGSGEVSLGHQYAMSGRSRLICYSLDPYLAAETPSPKINPAFTS
jgi:hypothetical protein